MSTSLLYHGFGIRGYNHVNVKYEKGDVIFTIEHNRSTLRCSNCGSRQVVKRGKSWQKFRSVPIGIKTVWICLAIQRVFCTACCLVRQVDIKFADSRRRYTRAFERYVLSLSRHMTIKDVAEYLAVSWDVVKDIQKRHLVRRYRKPKLKHLKRIAIDEISIGKGHQYLTFVLDLDTGVVVFVGDGKGPEALLPFWKRLKAARAKVRAVAIDISPAYIRAIVEHLPKTKIGFIRLKRTSGSEKLVI